jgi:glyoxylase-like metal-dependent hydrolase (beta-lactamase superfamily II)
MTLEGTNTYVVGSEPAYVVDPGPADAGHVEAVRSVAEDRGGIAGVVLTHSHADHSAAVPMLDAPLLFGEVGAADEASGAVHAAPPHGEGPPGWEGESLGPFEVLPTPGHATDHACFLIGDVALCGDLVLGRGSSFVPPDGGSLSAYIESLERLRAIDTALLCPGHGPYVTEPRVKLDEYIEHRLMRERKLVAALDGGERSRARLLAAAWDDVPPELLWVASMVMEAHLEKLDAEGRLPEGLRD